MYREDCQNYLQKDEEKSCTAEPQFFFCKQIYTKVLYWYETLPFARTISSDVYLEYMYIGIGIYIYNVDEEGFLLLEDVNPRWWELQEELGCSASSSRSNSQPDWSLHVSNFNLIYLRSYVLAVLVNTFALMFLVV